MPKRIVFYPRWTEENPATRLRAVAFAQELARRGFETRVETSEVPVRWDRGVEVLAPMMRTARRFLSSLARLGPRDVAYLVRLEAMPGIFPLVFALARRRGFKVVYDMDEAAYLRRPISAVGLARFAHGVVVAGHHLLSTVGRWNPNTVRVPTPVAMEDYPVRRHRPAGPMVVGFSGTPSNVPLLAHLAGPLRAVASRWPIEVRIITRPDAPVPEILPGAQRVIPWRLDTYRSHIADFDVGVMYIPSSPWWKAKMGYKLVEYQACGVPAVGSSVLSSEHPIAEGRTGFYATNEPDWEAALERLAADPGLRKRMGAAGRAWADEEYSLRRAGERLTPLLAEL